MAEQIRLGDVIPGSVTANVRTRDMTVSMGLEARLLESKWEKELRGRLPKLKLKVDHDRDRLVITCDGPFAIEEAVRQVRAVVADLNELIAAEALAKQ